jgi:hypothetical protein
VRILLAGLSPSPIQRRIWGLWPLVILTLPAVRVRVVEVEPVEVLDVDLFLFLVGGHGHVAVGSDGH